MSFVKVNEKSTRDQNICVAVRCRPLSRQEISSKQQSCVECFSEKKEVVITTDKTMSIFEQGKKRFTFDAVFGPESSQISVYKTVVAPLIEQVLLGYSCTVFAYGQTGTGKTFTMEGDRSYAQQSNANWEHDPLTGIIPRAINQIFEHLEGSSECNDFSVRVSFLEIYNEEMFDLLAGFSPNTKSDQQQHLDHHNSNIETNSNPNNNVQVKEGCSRPRMYEDTSRKGAVIISGLEEVHVRRKDQVYRILEKGSEKRQFAATQLNAHSSRSHTVFSVVVTMKESDVDGEDLLKTGKLYLVDLAGSENIGRSGAVDRRAREAGTINQSLLTLGRVINALTDKKSHVPYRESKLTRLLADSLGGRTKTCIIATVSPACSWLEETLSTLEYANRAKRIKNKPELNQRTTQRGLIKTYSETIARLKADLQAARDKNGIFLSQASYTEMTDLTSSQKLMIATLEANLECARNEYSALCDLFNKQNQKIERQQKNLNRARDWLKSAKVNLVSLSDSVKMLKSENLSKEYAIGRYADNEKELIDRLRGVVGSVEMLIVDGEVLHEKLAEERVFIEMLVKSVFGYEKNFLKKNFAALKQENIEWINRSVELKKSVDGELQKSLAESESLRGLLIKTFDENTSQVEKFFQSVLPSLLSEFKNGLAQVEQEQSETILRVGEKISESVIQMNKTHKLNVGVMKQLNILKDSLAKKNEMIKGSFNLDLFNKQFEEYNEKKQKFNCFVDEKQKDDEQMVALVSAQKSECLAEIQQKMKEQKNVLVKKILQEIDSSFAQTFADVQSLVDQKFDPVIADIKQNSIKTNEQINAFNNGMTDVFEQNYNIFSESSKKVGEILTQNTNEMQKFNEIMFLKLGKNNEKLKSDSENLTNAGVLNENASKNAAEKSLKLNENFSKELLNNGENVCGKLTVASKNTITRIDEYQTYNTNTVESLTNSANDYNNMLFMYSKHVQCKLENALKEYNIVKRVISDNNNKNPKKSTPAKPVRRQILTDENVVPEFLNLSATIKDYYKKQQDASLCDASAIISERLDKQGRRLFRVVDEMDSVNDVSDMPSADNSTTFSKTQHSCTDTMHEDFN